MLKEVGLGSWIEQFLDGECQLGPWEPEHDFLSKTEIAHTKCQITGKIFLIYMNILLTHTFPQITIFAKDLQILKLVAAIPGLRDNMVHVQILLVTALDTTIVISN